MARADQIQAEIAEVAGVLNAQHARLVGLVEEAIDAGVWEGWQIHSPQQWLALQAGLSPQRARSIVEVATKRSKFPAVTESFDRGELSIDQVATAVKAPEVNDESLANLAQACTVTQLRRVVRNYVTDDPQPNTTREGPSESEGPAETGGEAGPASHRRESCSVTELDNGWFRLSADLNFENGTILQSALAEAKDALFHNKARTEEQDAGSVTLSDALVEIVHRSLDNVEGSARRDRFKAYVHLNPDIESGPDALRITNQHGVPVGVVPPIPPTGPPPKPQSQYVHPTGERLDISQVFLD